MFLRGSGRSARRRQNGCLHSWLGPRGARRRHPLTCAPSPQNEVPVDVAHVRVRLFRPVQPGTVGAAPEADPSVQPEEGQCLPVFHFVFMAFSCPSTPVLLLAVG